MSSTDFVVIGAGPAGAAFAYYATQKGYRVKVFDIHKPGHKPCGWAIPVQIRRYISIPREFILTSIKGFRIFLDGRLVKEEEGSLWGYIVDKPGFLRYLIEAADFSKKPVKIDPHSLKPIDSASELSPRSTIIAVGGIGAAKAGGEFINAVQQIVRVREPLDTDTIEIWFDSKLVGYYWVFPRSSHEADVGVGGFGSFSEFTNMLTKFINTRFRDTVPVSHIKGARINIGGVNTSLFLRDSYPVIGEAAGFVYPITGEGIRPSIASAFALFRRIEYNENPAKVISNIIVWIARQRRLLEKIRESSPRVRASVLESLPVDLFTSIGLGELDLKTSMKLMLTLPRSAVKVLQALLRG